MSYDIELQKNGEVVQVPRHAEGGTYALGGTEEAHLNVTYNYAPHYYEHLDAEQGIRWLYGKTGAETEERLQAAVEELGTSVWEGPYYVPTLDAITSGLWQKWKEAHGLPDDFTAIALNSTMWGRVKESAIVNGLVYNTGGYWAPTSGNAGYALNILLGWAKIHPDAVWTGD